MAALKNLALLTIGFDQFALECAKAIKAFELLQGAMEVERDFNAIDRARYVVKGPTSIKLEMVSPDQIDMPNGTTTPVASKPRHTRLLR
ncbi:MAG: hypothetical protein ACK4KV_09485 [Rhodocyclaceae bacterium]